MRKFNVSAICNPQKHYMVDTTDKLIKIKQMIDQEEYFTINRGRQYGKTTTLLSLEKFLAIEYMVISISFEGIGDDAFSSEAKFCREFLLLIIDALTAGNADEAEINKWKNESVDNFSNLSRHISQICKNTETKYVLMIDEVDKSSNNTIFLNFLGKLRDKYIARNAGKDATFYSVILAGVYDIKNIKLKLIQEGMHQSATGETTYNNSPWNIAANFTVDMSFSIPEIESMLIIYEQDYKTGMNTTEIASEIHNYTSGYPVLVSKVCKYIDEELDKNWTTKGVRQAVKLILKEEDNPLFDSLIKNLTGNEELFILTKRLITDDLRLIFNTHNQLISLGIRYGFLANIKNRVAISNKIFEIVLTNYFISVDESEFALTETVVNFKEDGIITADGFNMELCLERFANYYHQYFSHRDEKFIERQASMLFLMFITSLLNGEGFVYIEAGLADGRLMDIVATYKGKQFIIETKIWRGDKKHQEAYSQLEGYMDKLSLNEGYLLTFNFNKTKKKHQKWIDRGNGRKILDVMV